jgi:hypothetical protein
MRQALPVLGAVSVLAGFTGAQFRLLVQRAHACLLLNLLGLGVLAVLVLAER